MTEIFVLQSLDAIQSYLDREHRAYYGMLRGEVPGGFCHFHTCDRSYFAIYAVKEKTGRVALDLYPQCICEKPYYAMLCAYVHANTPPFGPARVDIHKESGEVKVHVEAGSIQQPVSAQDLEYMMDMAIAASDKIERRLDRIAHGCYFDEKDPLLMGTMEKRHEELESLLDEIDLEEVEDMDWCDGEERDEPEKSAEKPARDAQEESMHSLSEDVF